MYILAQKSILKKTKARNKLFAAKLSIEIFKSRANFLIGEARSNLGQKPGNASESAQSQYLIKKKSGEI